MKRTKNADSTCNMSKSDQVKISVLKGHLVNYLGKGREGGRGRGGCTEGDNFGDLLWDPCSWGKSCT